MPTDAPSRLHAPISCPTCGAIFTTAADRRRRRVECPKCHQVVAIESPYAFDVSEVEAADLPCNESLPARAESERLAELEARVHTLEQALASRLEPLAAPEGEAATPRRLRWLPREGTLSESVPFILDGTREEALQYNLGQAPGSAIAIRCTAGNLPARQFAERLKVVFERSSWRVVGIDEVPEQADDHGLSLSAGSLPAPPELASAFLAFVAAGVPVASRLDPQLGPAETVLLVS